MSESGQAIIGSVKTKPHPNADRLQLGEVFGLQCVVGLDITDGELGVFFPEGLQLSEEYATANDLIRRKNADGTFGGGMFEINRKVRCKKFRGEKSEGYWAKLSSLAFTGADLSSLKEGDMFDELNGVPLCQKFISRHTYAGREKRKRSSNRGATPMFPKHFDTQQLRFHYSEIPVGSKVIITEKIHGTSSRFGYVLESRKLSWWERILKFAGLKIQTEEWTHLLGTRNVIGTHAPFRIESSQPFIGKLHKGEVVFYEIVGFEDKNTPIMPRVWMNELKDKSLLKQYGDRITYKYGCNEDAGDIDIYVYRIAYTTPDGEKFDLSWERLKKRCEELGVKHVPEFEILTFTSEEDLRIRTAKYIEGCDVIDPSHPREGVCVRIESGMEMRIFKDKSFTFKLLEGIVKEDDSVIDMEEVS